MPRGPLLSHRLLLLAGLLAACGGEPSTPATAVSPAAPTSPVPATSTVDRDPPSTAAPSVAPPGDLEGLDGPPPVPDEPAPVTGALREATPPDGTCVLLSDSGQRVLEEASSVDVLDDGEAFVVAGYLGTTPESVGVARIVPGGAPQLLARVELEGRVAPERRAAPPLLARLSATELALAVVDARARVLLATFDPTLPAPSVRFLEIAGGAADLRFPPAVRAIDAGRAVAYTDATERTTHVQVVVVDAPGHVTARHDVTPTAGAAAAPLFAPDGALYTVDARAGISVVHRVTLSADGTPSTPTVVRPLNLAAEPPAFAVIGTALAYTAVGNMATRAVGLLRIGTDDRATAIVSGLGYGAPLTLDGLPLGEGALFAADAPSAAAADAPHETRLRVLRGDGSLGADLVIDGVTGPRLARTRAGVVGLAVRGGLVYFARCAP